MLKPRIEIDEFARKASPNTWVTARGWATLLNIEPCAVYPRLARYIKRGFLEMRVTEGQKEYMMPATQQRKILAIPKGDVVRMMLEEIEIDHRDTKNYKLFDLAMRA